MQRRATARAFKPGTGKTMPLVAEMFRRTAPPTMTRHQKRAIREVVREELFELQADQEQPVRIHRWRPPDLSIEDFDTRLHDAVGELANPETVHARLTVETVHKMLDMSRNSLASYFERYGYSQDNERPARTLKRLAHEWFPQWNEV